MKTVRDAVGMDPSASRFQPSAWLNCRLMNVLWQVLVLGLYAVPEPLVGQDAYWIWSPEHSRDEVPLGAACYFRKQIEGPEPEAGKLVIAADDAYEVFINGRFVGRGTGSQGTEYDITEYLSRSGANLIAVRVINQRGKTAGLAAQVRVKELGGPWRSYPTDRSWRTNLSPLPLWNTTLYNDRRWHVAQAWDRWTGGASPLQARGPQLQAGPAEATQPMAPETRFQVAEEFEVRTAVDPEQTGSVLTFTFNEFGHLVVSRENGPLLIGERTGGGQWKTLRTYCDKVKNCQGLLALNGELYVTGEGPEGPALYRLSDRDRDGVLEHVKSLIRFNCQVTEHGAHGIELGPDGALYVVLGNHASPVEGYPEQSPYRGYYEGDLVPRYEDPSGHAHGIKAPGGVVLRTDPDGRKWEVVAGGLRNAYDLVFHPWGELFVHDSDMEFDVGTPWYRPTQLFHILPGGEYGWRSGWAKWPSYFVDALPGILDTGRGSPTGAVVYDHFMFPKRYHETIFLADWSEGRILNVTLEPNGAGYTARSEVFLTGTPLNVTALEVGPDGALYFSTGGRGTGGGIYQVRWRGTVPEAVTRLGQGISLAIRQPQFQSAWSRQVIATVKDEMAAAWSRNITGVARSPANPPSYRVRALDIMQLFGPPPSRDFLVMLASDEQPQVRAKAAELMALHANNETHQALIGLLQDPDPRVRRKACESLARAGQTVDWKTLIPLLTSQDRYEAWAARRLLERLPVDSWKDEVLATDNHRLFIQGSLALLIAHPSAETALDIIRRISRLMEGFIADQDFVDILRVAQVALYRGQITADQVPQFARQIGEEFPAGNDHMNRELVRLIAYLQVTEPMDRYIEFLDANVPDVEKLHLAVHLRFLRDGWRTDQKLRLLDFLEEMQMRPGGGSYLYYLRSIERDFARDFSSHECVEVLERGETWPSAALGCLYNLPHPLPDSLRDKLMALDKRLQNNASEHYKPLKVGLVAALAQHGDSVAQEYLRQLWEIDPDRRHLIALALAQSPDGENWNYLVRSLPILEGDTLVEVLRKLIDVPKAPAEPEYIRQLILAALRLEDRPEDALELLAYWTGENPTDPQSPAKNQVADWQKWFTQKYPDLPEPRLPQAEPGARWKIEELLAYLNSEAASDASATRGADVFTKAQCAKCHRIGDRGEAMGPDLTTIAKRFTKKETLQSILYPSYIVSDQYAAKTVVTTKGRTYTGMVSISDGRATILQSNGDKVDVPESEIEEIKPSRTSAMPAGLIDALTQEEIADLFAFLGYRAPAKVAQRAVNSVK